MEDDRIEVTIGENTKVQIIRSTITSLLKKEEIKNNFFVLNFSKINVLIIYSIYIHNRIFFLNFQNEKTNL